MLSIGLFKEDDPQQIFESLKATGQPLTESEKVKNWLLIGLPESKQQELYDNGWKRIEQSLGAEYNTKPIDVFLRDFLRWKTGRIQGIDHVYEALRRWAFRERLAEDRPALCRDLARLADLYGILTGTAGEHKNADVERQLRHLRAMGIDVHRPLTLRLLHEEGESKAVGSPMNSLADILEGIATWTTRLWLADRAVGGMNRAVVELAHGSGPDSGEDDREYWFNRIRKLQHTRVGVPSDKAVREGLRTRKAYGGSATRSSFAVLCALMEADHREETPARDHLTIEHVMPKKLTEDWKKALGAHAKEIHGQYRDQLANLTLSGDATNSTIGAGTFGAKCKVYELSSIGLTRTLATYLRWDKDTIEQRAEDLVRRALDCWPWKDQDRDGSKDLATLRWRIENGDWQKEKVASHMLLNVVAALPDLDPKSAESLSGESFSSNLQSAEHYPPGTKVGTLTMRAVPGHENYVLYPYRRNKQMTAQHCRKIGERCGVSVDAEFSDTSPTQAF